MKRAHFTIRPRDFNLFEILFLGVTVFICHCPYEAQAFRNAMEHTP